MIPGNANIRNDRLSGAKNPVHTGAEAILFQRLCHVRPDVCPTVAVAAAQPCRGCRAASIVPAGMVGGRYQPLTEIEMT